MSKAAALIARTMAAIGAGALGGWVCGFIILETGSYLGRGGNYGVGPEEGFGYWNPEATFILAGFYGTFIGALVFPIGYLGFLQKVPLHKALAFTLAGTLGGGLSGALASPPIAAVLGVSGFLIAAAFASAR
jgi:hypothetical protein